MSGAEQLAAWLFGSLCAAVAVCRVARWLALGRAEVARLYSGSAVEVARAEAGASQEAPVYVPQEWNPQEGL